MKTTEFGRMLRFVAVGINGKNDEKEEKGKLQTYFRTKCVYPCLTRRRKKDCRLIFSARKQKSRKEKNVKLKQPFSPWKKSLFLLMLSIITCP